MFSSSFSYFSSLFCCSYSPLPQLHTYTQKQKKKTKTKNPLEKNKDTTKTSNKDTKLIFFLKKAKNKEITMTSNKLPHKIENRKNKQKKGKKTK
jgi:hypothetical protein